MTNYTMHNANGIVSIGDTLTSFRGESAVLINVDQYPTPGKSGKLTTTIGTHYPSVYNVTFTPVEDRPGMPNRAELVDYVAANLSSADSAIMAKVTDALTVLSFLDRAADQAAALEDNR